MGTEPGRRKASGFREGLKMRMGCPVEWLLGVLRAIFWVSQSLNVHEIWNLVSHALNVGGP